MMWECEDEKIKMMKLRVNEMHDVNIMYYHYYYQYAMYINIRQIK